MSIPYAQCIQLKLYYAWYYVAWLDVRVIVYIVSLGLHGCELVQETCMYSFVSEVFHGVNNA